MKAVHGPSGAVRPVLWLIAVASVLALSWSLAPATSEAAFKPGLNKLKSDKGKMFRQHCLVGRGSAHSPKCFFGHRDSSTSVVLFGDSHAMQWGPALIEVAKRRDWRIVALLKASCTAADVSLDSKCNAWRHNSLKRIRRIKPKLVLVASATVDLYDEAGPYLADGMADTLRRLRSYSKRTVVMRDQAVTPFSTTACLRVHTHDPNSCGFVPDRSDYESYDKAAADRVRGVGLIDPQPMLCPDGWCRAVDGELVIYRNFGHMSATFIESKGKWLARKLGVKWGPE